MSDDMTVEHEADGSTRLTGDTRASDMTLFGRHDRAIVHAAAEQFVNVIAMLVSQTPIADDDVVEDMEPEAYARACGEVVTLTAQGVARIVLEVMGDLVDTTRIAMPTKDGREVVLELRRPDE